MFRTSSSLPVWALLVIVCRLDVISASTFSPLTGVNVIDTLSSIFHTSINETDDSESLVEGLKKFNLLPENDLGLRELEKLGKQLLNFSRMAKEIENKYIRYLEYSIIKLDGVDQSILEPPNFNEMKRQLGETHKILFDPNGVLHTVENYIEELAHVCAIAKSQQLYIYELLRYVVVAELRGYMVLKFALELEKDQTGHDTKNNLEELNRNTRERLSDILSSFSDKMISVSRQIWKCDPSEHIEDETFTELKQVFKKIILNELDFEGKMCSNTCPTDNDDISPNCYRDMCKAQRSCSRVIDCTTINSKWNACLSKNQTSRRYDFIDDKSNRKCHDEEFTMRKIEKLDSLPWSEDCSYCMCTCVEEEKDSDHYFDLNYVTSDIDSNYVVSGLRLQKVNHVVHLQIQQGKIDKGGLIQENTVSWKPINVYGIRAINLSHTNDSKPIESVNYMELKWSNEQQILLDDVVAPEGHVITGVKFSLQPFPLYDNLQLKIRSTPYNFETGQLLKEKSFWSGFKESNDREELKLLDSDSPKFVKGKNLVDSKPNQFLKFTTTGWNKLDAGQSTIPFLDIQPVVPTPPVAISGVGIYHKSIKGSGGYLGIKLSTYNFVPILSNLSSKKSYL